ncbi:MAG: hemerythrin domain-containing protein [Planctomycetota bacterium]
MTDESRTQGRHPVDILEDEHKVILAVVAALDKERKTVVSGGELKREFIVNFADRCHHAKEEDLLFPLLVELGMPEDQGPIYVMNQEHIEGRNYTRMLRESAEAGDREGVLTASAGYVALLEEHIEKENGILFEHARGIIPRERVQELLASFEAVEKEKFGPETQRRYRDLARSLCMESGVAVPSGDSAG